LAVSSAVNEETGRLIARSVLAIWPGPTAFAAMPGFG
jgi:hypothetical protein